MTPRQILHIITVSSGEPVLLELLPVVAEHTADMTIVHCPPPVALLLDVSLGLEQAVRVEATLISLYFFKNSRISSLSLSLEPTGSDLLVSFCKGETLPELTSSATLGVSAALAGIWSSLTPGLFSLLNLSLRFLSSLKLSPSLFRRLLESRDCRVEYFPRE